MEREIRNLHYMLEAFEALILSGFSNDIIDGAKLAVNGLIQDCNKIIFQTWKMMIGQYSKENEKLLNQINEVESYKKRFIDIKT